MGVRTSSSLPKLYSINLAPIFSPLMGEAIACDENEHSMTEFFLDFLSFNVRSKKASCWHFVKFLSPIFL